MLPEVLNASAGLHLLCSLYYCALNGHCLHDSYHVLTVHTRVLKGQNLHYAVEVLLPAIAASCADLDAHSRLHCCAHCVRLNLFNCMMTYISDDPSTATDIRCELTKWWYKLVLLKLPTCLKALRHGDIQHQLYHGHIRPHMRRIRGFKNTASQSSITFWWLKVAQSNVLCTVLGLPGSIYGVTELNQWALSGLSPAWLVLDQHHASCQGCLQ